MAKLFAAFVLVFLLQISWTPFTEGGRILVIFSPPAPSHFFLGKAIVTELVNRGHDVTFINSFGSKIQKKNIKDVVLTGFVDKMEGYKKQIFEIQEKSILAQFSNFLESMKWMTEEAFNNTAVQKLLKSDQKFDLVIMETFLSESHVGFAHHYDCPLIVVGTVGANFWSNHFVGNQAPPSFVPQMMLGLPSNMNFWQRAGNFFVTYVMEAMYHMLHLPAQDALMHKYFPSAPSLNEVIQKRVQLVLLNSHPSINQATPLVPNMIEIGGFHVTEPKPLPKELKDYLDSAKEGFILFSMGSNIRSNMLPIETREILMKVFAKLPYQILWKFEDDNMPNKPDNVRIDKWLPQNDILPHPNLKLFITHGGLLSTTEAAYHGVPVVGIPVLGDQKVNMAGAENLGVGKAIDFKQLTYEGLLATVQEVLNNKAYREKARARSALFRDQPMRPIDSAAYWIEFVLRHKNLDHLKTGAIYLNWFQIHSLDVIALFGSIIFGVLSIFYILVKQCCCRRKSCTEDKAKIVKKKNQ